MFCKQKLYIVIYDKAPFKAGLQHYPTLYIIHGKTSANFFYFFLFEVAFISLIFFSLFAFTPQSTHRTAVIFNELVNCILMNKCNYRKSYTHDEQVVFFKINSDLHLLIYRLSALILTPTLVFFNTIPEDNYCQH